MKRIFCTLAFLFAVAASVVAQTPLSVVSYNLRLENSGDDERGDGWAKRLPHIANQLLFVRPDIFGTQELKHNQVMNLCGAMPDYAFTGVAREDGKEEGEYAAIFYNTKRLTLLRSGNFWLSETPDKPSLGWDAQCVRICTWGEFSPLDNPDCKFYMFNMHMDHVGVVARSEGGRLVLKKIQEIAEPGATVILSGDFNVDQTSEVYQVFADSQLLEDTYEKATVRMASNGTYNAFDPNKCTVSRIDHIFVTENIDVERYAIVTDTYWDTVENATEHTFSEAPQEIKIKEFRRRVISDHYPVMVYLTLK